MEKWVLYAVGAVLALGVAGLALLSSAYVLLSPPKDLGIAPIACCGPVALVAGVLGLLCAFLAYREYRAMAAGAESKTDTEKKKGR